MKDAAWLGRWSVGVVAALSLPLVSGCAEQKAAAPEPVVPAAADATPAAQPPPPPPAPPPNAKGDAGAESRAVSSAAEPRDVAADVATIAAAGARIDALFGPADKRANAPSAGGKPGAPQARGHDGVGATDCSAACSALASMSRATDHLCSIAGEADARCSDARSRTKGAEQRVQAGCPACR